MTTKICISLLSHFLLLLLIVSSTMSSELCHPDDKKALLSIMKSFENAELFASWSPKTDCCKDWYIVKCDQNNRIYSIFITSPDSINGTIPDAIGDLPYLSSLEIHKQSKLIGPIPRAINRLKNLGFLSLSHNNLSGPIPDFLSELKKLTLIDLSFNYLSGPIPTSLADLPELSTLTLDRNQLTGSIPESFGRFKSNQDFYLSLTKNHLSGQIPYSLGALNFSLLFIDRNNFTGDASMLFGKDKGVQNMYISRNKFSFNMTNIELPPHLYNLDISHNLIYGTIPPTVADLVLFNASYNRFCGQIPNTTFDEFCFQHNKCLCGSPLQACN